MTGVNQGHFRLKMSCLVGKNREETSLSPGPRTGKFSCLLKFVQDLLRRMGAARLRCMARCIIAFPHGSLAGIMLQLRCLAQGGLNVQNSSIFKGFEISHNVDGCCVCVENVQHADFLLQGWELSPFAVTQLFVWFCALPIPGFKVQCAVALFNGN